MGLWKKTGFLIVLGFLYGFPIKWMSFFFPWAEKKIFLPFLSASSCNLVIEGGSSAHRDFVHTFIKNTKTPLFRLDINHLKQRVEELPQVYSVAVVRKAPSTLLVRISQRHGVVWWQHKGRLVLLDQQGNPMIPPPARSSSPPFASPSQSPPQEPPHGAGLSGRPLLLVVGEEAPYYIDALFDTLSHFPHINAQLKAAVCFRSGRWNLHLHNGWIVKLPLEKPSHALDCFDRLEKTLFFKDTPIVSIDLRLFPSAIVRVAPSWGKKLRQHPTHPKNFMRDI